MIDDAELAMMRERCRRAPPGPWEWKYDDAQDPWLLCAGSAIILMCGECDGECTPGPLAAEFIAAARTDMPKLLCEVERLKGELVKWRELASL